MVHSNTHKSSDDTKTPISTMAAVTLPKPIILGGSDDKDLLPQADQEEKVVKDETKNLTQTKSDDEKAVDDDEKLTQTKNDDSDQDRDDQLDEDALPMPIAFDDEEEEEEDKNKLTKLPPPVQIGKNTDDEVDEDEKDSFHIEPLNKKSDVDVKLEPIATSQEEDVKLEPVAASQEEVEIVASPSVISAEEASDSFVNNSEIQDEPEKPIEMRPIEVGKADDDDLDFDIPEIKPIAPASNTLLDEYESGSVDSITKSTPAEVSTLSGDDDQVIPRLGGVVAADALQMPSVAVAPNRFPLAKIGTGVALVFLGGGIVVGGYFASSAIFSKQDAESIPQQAVSETAPMTNPPLVQPTPAAASPSATPKAIVAKPEIKLAELKVKILNGSGVKGAANKAKALMEDLGFDDIVVGNADDFDYTKTEVQLKAEYETLYDPIEKTLSKGYVVKQSDAIEEDDTYDVYVILGSDEPKAKASESEL